MHVNYTKKGKMKIFFALFIVVPILADVDVAKTPEELSARIESHHRECSEISHVDPQVLSKARNGDVDFANEALKKHLFCYLKKADLANDNDLNRPVLKAKLEAQLKGSFDVQKGMDGCDAEVKKEGDYTLYLSRIVSCYCKNFPKGTKLL